MTFVDFHLVVSGDMAVSAAHNICDRIERALREAVEDAMITIHVEPEQKAKHAGIVVCSSRCRVSVSTPPGALLNFPSWDGSWTEP